jgi:hypothetical protein
MSLMIKVTEIPSRDANPFWSLDKDDDHRPQNEERAERELSSPAQAARDHPHEP